MYEPRCRTVTIGAMLVVLGVAATRKGSWMTMSEIGWSMVVGILLHFHLVHAVNAGLQEHEDLSSHIGGLIIAQFSVVLLSKVVECQQNSAAKP